jgi:hypothetical protein
MQASLLRPRRFGPGKHQTSSDMKGKPTMKNTKQLMSLLLVAALGFVGCTGTYNGGGAMQSASGIPGEKATFGFTIHVENDGVDCDNIAGVSGQFQYVDHGLRIGFHARIVSHAFVIDETDVHLAFVGEYLVRGRPAGQVLIRVEDHGRDSKSDFLWISVLSGPFQGYFNAGTFEKGNITYHPDKLCL